jgi:hypothetical protein
MPTRMREFALKARDSKDDLRPTLHLDRL